MTYQINRRNFLSGAAATATLLATARAKALAVLRPERLSEARRMRFPIHFGRRLTIDDSLASQTEHNEMIGRLLTGYP